MEAHDLVLAKCAAGRERDWEFAAHAITHELVDPDELLKREPDLPLSPEHPDHLRAPPVRNTPPPPTLPT